MRKSNKVLYMRERGAEYFFPKDAIIKFYKNLPSTDFVDSIYAEVSKKIAIITHDDIYDTLAAKIEESYKVKSTYFLLSYRLRNNLAILADLQFHFDKGYGGIKKQILTFKRKLGKTPLINRNHRFWWRSDNLDLAYLALNGFIADSTKVGIKPYLLCVEGKILPIWEVPFSVYEPSVDHSIHAGYRIAKDLELLFVKEKTPLVGLFHPQDLSDINYEPKISNLERFISFGKEYGYEFMTMNDFVQKVLMPQSTQYFKGDENG